MSKISEHCLFLRLADNARHSQVDFDEIEQLADCATLKHDGRDYSVYYLSLPADFDTASANSLISTLVTKPYIDEAWLDGSATQIKPQP